MKSTVGREHPLDLPPLSVGRGIVQPLNGVAGGDNEGRVFSRDLLPEPLIHIALSLSGAITENDEAERVRRGRSRCRRGYL